GPRGSAACGRPQTGRGWTARGSTGRGWTGRTARAAVGCSWTPRSAAGAAYGDRRRRPGDGAPDRRAWGPQPVRCHDVPVRAGPTMLDLDRDAFYAAVEQRDKPSLRGRPVVVGGVGGRGVVATASYEARAYGVRSAMSTREARARCPHAAYLSGRFDAYRAASALVMEQLRRLSPLVEPLSLDEAFVDLAAGDALAGTADDATGTAVAERLKADVHEVTEGLTASVGIGSSKLIAKIASDLRKPDGLVVVAPGTERDLLRPMPITTIP